MLCILETTCSSLEEAQMLAKAAVQQKQAACCHIIPIHSCYEWEGDLVNDGELLVRFKTLKENIHSLTQLIKKLHSYDVPALLQIDIKSLSDEYTAWVLSQCEHKASS